MNYNSLFPSSVSDNTVGVYKITNLTNHHCYIGKSVQMRVRWRNHIHASMDVQDVAYNYPLMRAFRKYGINNFQFELLEQTTVEELNIKELYYIRFYNACSNGNYNQVDNMGGYTTTPDYVLAVIADLRNTFDSYIILAQRYNISQATIGEINAGRMWKQPNLQYPIRKQGEKNKFLFGKPVVCLDKKTGEVIKEYSCAGDFAEEHPELERHNVYGHINEVCKGKRKSAYGFKWQYKD